MGKKDERSMYTTLHTRWRDPDICRGTSGVWCYRKVPLAPVIDARSAMAAADAMSAVSDALASIAPLSGTGQLPHRNMSRSKYREVHLLALNIPREFVPIGDTPLAEYLRQNFREEVSDRHLIIGVKLVPAAVGASLRSSISGTLRTIVSGQVNVEDFFEDAAKVGRALASAGCSPMSDADYERAETWWNFGNRPDIPMLEHPTHIHMFRTPESASHAQMLQNAGSAHGEQQLRTAPDCETWPASHLMSGLIVRSLGLKHRTPATSPSAWWGAELMQAGAVAISIRGLLEPPSITRQELRRSRTRIQNDQAELADSGVADRSELMDLEADLTLAEDTYAHRSAPPALIDGSAVVWTPEDSPEIFSDLCITDLHPADFRQQAALLHALLCSSAGPLRAPFPFDAPITTIASFGLNNLSTVGESTPNGGRNALLGFTESDRQPVWMSPIAQSRGDSPPLALVVGQTGSGKTMMMLWMAHQFAEAGTPVVVVDPKMGSDHSAAVSISGGQTYSLDGLIGEDGVLDPLRTAKSIQAGVDMAASMLLGINPWGTHREDVETPLMVALHAGAEAGARSTGAALLKAVELGQASMDLVQPVVDLHRSSAMFRALVGVDSSAPPLNVASGITYITVGSVHLDLPAPGTTQPSQQQRISLAMVRALVVASSMALSGRDGVVMLDEAWVFTDAGASELDRLGRLARSQRVLPMLFTQRVSDALNAGLANYTSQVFVLPIQEPAEAHAALVLAELDPTPERISRLRARATVGDTDPVPNFRSMRALIDPVTREVIRPAVCLYSDLRGRTVPVEVSIPDSFIRQASTNADDINLR